MSNLYILAVAAQVPPPTEVSDVIEGMLTRKHEWESTTKKASNRSLYYHI